jgi:hypothetical protein
MPILPVLLGSERRVTAVLRVAPDEIPQDSANSIQPLNIIADRVAYVHSSLFSPALSTWCAAIDAGRLAIIPVTAAQL